MMIGLSAEIELIERRRELLTAVLKDQETEIRERFGPEAADRANYAQGIEESDLEIKVTTKVYGRGWLVSRASDPRAIRHDLEEA